MKTMNKKIIGLLLDRAIEPNSSNIYSILINSFSVTEKTFGTQFIRTDDLINELQKASKKWNKEIDKII